jgi:hypothetical protein
MADNVRKNSNNSQATGVSLATPERSGTTRSGDYCASCRNSGIARSKPRA